MTTLTAHEIDDEMNILLSEAKRIKDRDYDRQLSRADSGSSLNRAFIGDSSELKMVNGSSQFSMISISEIGPVPQDNILYDIESPD